MRPSKPAVRLAVVALLVSAGALAAADRYALDPDHASVVFKVNHLGFSHTYGRFNKVEGELVLDEAAPAKSSLRLTIDAESVDTGNARRDAHLRGPDFFDCKQFPKITFTSKAMRKAGDKVWEVTGDLALHGVTKSLTLTVHQLGTGQDPWGKTRTGGDLEFTVKRSEFGMNFMPGGIGDDVTLMVSIEGIKQ